MDSSFSKKSLFSLLEFLGLYTIIWILIGIGHLSFSKFPTDFFGKGEYEVLLSQNIISSIKWIVVSFLITMCVWMARKGKDGWTLRDLGYRIHRSWGRDIWFGVVVFSLIYLIRIPIKIMNLPLITPRFSESPYYNAILNPSFPSFLLICTVLFSAASTFFCAFWEEIFWRGYVQNLFSQKVSPLTGFFIAAIVFSISHHFTRPEFGILDICNNIISSVSFGIIFYVTGSLFSVVVVHFLGNFLWEFTIALFVTGNTQGSTFLIGVFGILTLILCILGRKEIKLFFQKTKELFTRYGWKMGFFGMLFGIVGLAYEWGRSILITDMRSEKPGLLFLIMILFAGVTLGISYLYKEKKKENVSSSNNIQKEGRE